MKAILKSATILALALAAAACAAPGPPLGATADCPPSAMTSTTCQHQANVVAANWYSGA